MYTCSFETPRVKDGTYRCIANGWGLAYALIIPVVVRVFNKGHGAGGILDAKDAAVVRVGHDSVVDTVAGRLCKVCEGLFGQFCFRRIRNPLPWIHLPVVTWLSGEQAA